MSFKELYSKNRKYLVFLAAVVTPGGFIMLGVYKAYDIYKKRQLAKDQRPKSLEEYVQKLKEEI